MISFSSLLQHKTTSQKIKLIEFTLIAFNISQIPPLYSLKEPPTGFFLFKTLHSTPWIQFLCQKGSDFVPSYLCHKGKLRMEIEKWNFMLMILPISFLIRMHLCHKYEEIISIDDFSHPRSTTLLDFNFLNHWFCSCSGRTFSTHMGKLNLEINFNLCHTYEEI